MLVHVLIASRYATILTYSAASATIGQVVHVTIKGKLHLGIVWEVDVKSDLTNILPVHEVTTFVLSAEYLAFLKKAAEYNVVSCSEILYMSLTDLEKHNLSSIYYRHEGKLCSISYLIRVLGKRKLNKLLVEHEVCPAEFQYTPISDNLNESQGAAWDKIRELGFAKPLVIQGKTGSGKTNLYFAIVNKVLAENKKVLILMPEIALTNAFADRIYEYFGFFPHIWNSDITSVAKSIVWTWSMSDEPGILIGSRSALWLPLINLGLIVVDEEHDNSYKQENSPRYHARDMSVLRKKYQNCAVVLVSATPSLETWFNVEQGKYNLVTLEGDQPITAQIIHRKPGEWLSADLKDAISYELEKGNQCMLFLNRKGLARSVFCGVCHEYLMCNYCSANLVLYRNFVVSCSYCGKQNYLNTCNNCSNSSWQTYGIGIEQIEEDVKKIFPQAMIGKFSGDLKNLRIAEIHSGKINLIISTQILAKGFNFLNLSLVGIIQADHGLQSNDPRNTEKIYQLLTQVRGRCGRNNNESKVLLQSTNSKSPVLESILKNDFVSWAKDELEFRRASKLPPIFKLIRVVVYGSNMENTAFDAKCMYHALSGQYNKYEVFQPAPNQLHKYKSKFYYSIIIRYYHTTYPQPNIKLSNIKLPKKSKFFIDVDPQHFV